MFKNILNIINWKVFFISFLVGLIFIYLKDDKKKIYVYPTPSNVNKVEYKDKADNCYEYSMDQVKCPSSKSEIHNVPLQ
jgi:hypothetical protein